MADQSDSKRVSVPPDEVMVETSFGGSDHDEDFLNIEYQGGEREDTCEQHERYSTDVQNHHRVKQPGLITRIGRGVKKAVGGAIGEAFNVLVGPNQNAASELDFVDSCKKAGKVLTKLNSKYGERVISRQVLQEMNKTIEVLEKKDICISVFGQHNCGKSTLLNAMIGEELLPVYEMSETSVKIKIQHDSNIHQGVCAQNCHTQHGSYQQLKSCPKLQVLSKEGRKEIKGAEAIYEFLTELNKRIRRKTEKTDVEPPVVILKVNIPLLAGRVPPGWTVSLVDNPGFGEAKEHVVQLADASLITSSAYIYLLQTENIGGTEAADFFKELIKKDRGALRDGRLAVGVTKFDTNYGSKSKRRARRSSTITVEKVRENMISSIEDATEETVTDDTIIPLCGEWALAASRFASCLISDPNNEKQERLEDAVEALQNFPHLSLPGGQEQSLKETIQNLEPKALIALLEKASGVSDLKSRIHYVVGNACVKVWATKILTEFQHYLQAGDKGIEERCKYLADAIAEKGKKLGNDQDLYDEVMWSRKRIQSTAPKKSLRKKTSIWKEFETNYQKDLEKYEPQEQGKLKVIELVNEFKDQCRRKIAGRNFSPADFENSIQVFLSESAPKLQKVFDSSCGFWNVQSVLMDHTERMVETVTNLRSNARLLCGLGTEEFTESYRRGTMSETRALSAPNLADIKLRVKIPSVSLSWWQTIIKMFRSLQDKISMKLDQLKEEDPVRDTEESSEPSYPSVPLLCTETDESEDESDESEDESDESDSDNECEKSKGDSQHLTGVELNAISLDVDQSVCAGSMAAQSSIAIDQTEDETDNGSRDRSAFKKRTYRKWTEELEYAIEELQRNMKLECEKYFKKIMPKAIKFFYKEYRRKVRDRLQAFDKDFNGHLEQKHRTIKELKHEIDSLEKEYYELQAKKIDMRKLSQQVFNAYSYEFARQQV